ncbi:hypothetical protein ACW1A7_003057, partial [Acinetobacter baumannii]|uniref:hypothetical protein n=2 Tax=Acinetobacter baumannii TaxID=470 RepID=UPI00003D94E1
TILLFKHSIILKYHDLTIHAYDSQVQPLSAEKLVNYNFCVKYFYYLDSSIGPFKIMHMCA